MLTPKKKAEELVLRFIQDTYTDRYMGIMQAKECAKIAVEEILNINSVDKDYYLNDYWQKVKEEIENI